MSIKHSLRPITTAEDDLTAPTFMSYSKETLHGTMSIVPDGTIEQLQANDDEVIESSVTEEDIIDRALINHYILLLMTSMMMT